MIHWVEVAEDDMGVEAEAETKAKGEAEVKAGLQRGGNKVRCSLNSWHNPELLSPHPGQRRSTAGRDHQGEGRCQDAALARRRQGAGQVWLVQCRCLDQEGWHQEEEEVDEEGGGEEEEVVVDCQQYFVIHFHILHMSLQIYVQ